MELAVKYALLGALAFIELGAAKAGRDGNSSTGGDDATLIIRSHLVASFATGASVMLAICGIRQLGTWAACLPAIGLLGGMFALVFSCWFGYKHRRIIYLISRDCCPSSVQLGFRGGRVCLVVRRADNMGFTQGAAAYLPSLSTGVALVHFP